MKSSLSYVAWGAILAVFATVPAFAQKCESLASLNLPDANIKAAATMPAGPFVSPSATPAQASQTSDVLPEFCRVMLTVKPAIEIEVWMPMNWNGNFEAVGNGGFAGSIQYGAMSAALKLGYATASTDTGHKGGGANWALGHPELVADYGYRAIHEMTLKAKSLIESYYGVVVRVSYFSGCSNGGRQGLMEAQRFPDDYNGIISGAPANNWTRFEAGQMLWFTLATHKDPESYIPTSKLAAIDDATGAACDSLDGLKDGLIDNPRICHFNPKVLLCKGSDSPTCLSAKQVKALREVYAGPPRINGKAIFPPILPGGERAWAGFMTNPGPNQSVSYNLANDFFKFMVYDPNWDFSKWNYSTDVPYTDKKLAGTLNATDPNLSPFFKAGGKLILYQGWSDPVVSPLNVINYYNNVAANLSGAKGSASRNTQQAEQNVRLFMVPGMGHCFGGPGPNNFDTLSPMVDWVEHNKPPRKIVATHLTGKTVDRTRPLCPYPMTAQYTGQGSMDDAANFACKSKPGK